jgi:molybdopterin converting factor subunit 1
MKVKVRYFASLREQAGKSQEDIEIEKGKNLKDIYQELSLRYGFTLLPQEIKYSVNNDYVDQIIKLNENDVVVFIPPVAGG